MKYFATVDGQTYEIAVEGGGRVRVNGIDLSADMHRVGRIDLYSLLLDSRSHEALVEPDEQQRNSYCVLLAGQRYRVEVQDERSRRLAAADRSLKAPAGELVIRAPIPGLVVKVAVTPGQAVSEGETLLILEAMKMENELRSPRDGTVHEVRATAGAQVTLGQALVLIR